MLSLSLSCCMEQSKAYSQRERKLRTPFLKDVFLRGFRFPHFRLLLDETNGKGFPLSPSLCLPPRQCRHAEPTVYSPLSFSLHSTLLLNLALCEAGARRVSELFLPLSPRPPSRENSMQAEEAPMGREGLFFLPERKRRRGCPSSVSALCIVCVRARFFPNSYDHKSGHFLLREREREAREPHTGPVPHSSQ